MTIFCMTNLYRYRKFLASHIGQENFIIPVNCSKVKTQITQTKAASFSTRWVNYEALDLYQDKTCIFKTKFDSKIIEPWREKTCTAL